MNNFVTQLRWPPALRDAVRASAVANRRSINSEILAILEAKFAKPSGDKAEVAA